MPVEHTIGIMLTNWEKKNKPVDLHLPATVDDSCRMIFSVTNCRYLSNLDSINLFNQQTI